MAGRPRRGAVRALPLDPTQPPLPPAAPLSLRQAIATPFSRPLAHLSAVPASSKRPPFGAAHPAMFEPGVEEHGVRELMALGFPRADAEETLAACDGDVARAADALQAADGGAAAAAAAAAVAKHTERGAWGAVQYAVCTMQGRRQYMEDAARVVQPFGPDDLNTMVVLQKGRRRRRRRRKKEEEEEE